MTLEDFPEDAQCRCCGKHVPLPLIYYKLLVGGEIEWLCPTTYHNVSKLLASYRVLDRPPPGSIKKHYSKFVQNLVNELWEEHVAVQLTSPVDSGRLIS